MLLARGSDMTMSEWTLLFIMITLQLCCVCSIAEEKEACAANTCSVVTDNSAHSSGEFDLTSFLQVPSEARHKNKLAAQLSEVAAEASITSVVEVSHRDKLAAQVPEVAAKAPHRVKPATIRFAFSADASHKDKPAVQLPEALPEASLKPVGAQRVVGTAQVAKAGQVPVNDPEAAEAEEEMETDEFSLISRRASLVNSRLFALDDGCNDDLAGVTKNDVQTVFNHQTSSRWKQAHVAKQKYPVLANRSYFIAACLHQSAGILDQWSTELTKLILTIMNTEGNNVFLSVYESGSTDGTQDRLLTLGAALRALGVQNKINLGTLTKGVDEGRIDFLSKIRNLALDPIHTLDKEMHFDRVVWFNDDLFCASGPLQQIVLTEDPERGGSGADAACALDFDTPEGQCGFYDIWVAHDMAGQRFNKPFPYTSFGPSVQAVKSGKAFQVFSCWDGMVAFKADIFTKQKLTFRKGREDLGECRASEAELIFHDMWKIGRGKIVVAPNSLAAYTTKDYNTCVRGKQKDILTHQTVQYRKDPPHAVTCCPIQGADHDVNWNTCRGSRWEDAYGSADVPRSSSVFLQYGGLQNDFPKSTRVVLLPLSNEGPAHPYNGTSHLQM